MEHPITPPRELVQQWRKQWACCPQNRDPDLGSYIADQASQWGWDQRGAANEAELQQARDEELEACCEWLERTPLSQAIAVYSGKMRSLNSAPPAARKPPSLKEQALEAAQRFYAKGHEGCTDEEIKDDFSTICSALEALPND